MSSNSVVVEVRCYSNCDVLLVCAHAKDHGEHRVFNVRKLKAEFVILRYSQKERSPISRKIFPNHVFVKLQGNMK